MRRIRLSGTFPGGVSWNTGFFRHPNSSPATSASKSIILPSLWKAPAMVRPGALHRRANIGLLTHIKPRAARLRDGVTEENRINQM